MTGGMLKRRPGDDTRQRADAKLRVLEYVQSKPLDAVFSIATVSGGSGVPFNTVASQLDALVGKGVLVEVAKPGDARRHFKRTGRS